MVFLVLHTVCCLDFPGWGFTSFSFPLGPRTHGTSHPTSSLCASVVQFSLPSLQHCDSVRYSEQSYVVEVDYFSFITRSLSSPTWRIVLSGMCACVCYYFNFKLCFYFKNSVSSFWGAFLPSWCHLTQSCFCVHSGVPFAILEIASPQHLMVYCFILVEPCTWKLPEKDWKRCIFGMCTLPGLW